MNYRNQYVIIIIIIIIICNNSVCDKSHCLLASITAHASQCTQQAAFSSALVLVTQATHPWTRMTSGCITMPVDGVQQRTGINNNQCVRVRVSQMHQMFGNRMSFIDAANI